MPWYRVGAMLCHIRFGRKHEPASCREIIELNGQKCYCLRISQLQCDWKVGRGRTCDRWLCPDHGLEVGPDKHLCPAHQLAWDAWKAQRAAETAERRADVADSLGDALK